MRNKLLIKWIKLIASDSDIDEAIKSMYQSIMMKIKNSACDDWAIYSFILAAL